MISSRPLTILFAAVLAAAGTACAGSPAAPSPATAPRQAAIAVAPELQAAWDLLRATPGRPAWSPNDATIADWLAHVPIARIDVGPLAVGISGYAYADGRIVVNDQILQSRTPVLAAILAHEARHVDGSRHGCGTKDQTFGELGAWAIHVLTLELLHEDAIAAVLRGEQFCERETQ